MENVNKEERFAVVVSLFKHFKMLPLTTECLVDLFKLRQDSMEENIFYHQRVNEKKKII